jgi:hypothetical protein
MIAWICPAFRAVKASTVLSKLLVSLSGWDLVGQEGGPGDVDLGAPLQLLGVVDAVHLDALLDQDTLVGVEVGLGEVDHLVALGVMVTWLKSMS